MWVPSSSNPIWLKRGDSTKFSDARALKARTQKDNKICRLNDILINDMIIYNNLRNYMLFFYSNKALRDLISTLHIKYFG